MTKTLKCVTTGLPVWEVLTSFMGFDTENGYMKYGNRASFMSEKLKKTLETTQMLYFVQKKDDVLRQAYYKYVREDGHHLEIYRVLKVLYKRHIEGKHVPFQRYVINPEEREEIENDKQLPTYSRAFVQDARRTNCIAMLDNIVFLFVLNQ